MANSSISAAYKVIRKKIALIKEEGDRDPPGILHRVSPLTM